MEGGGGAYSQSKISKRTMLISALKTVDVFNFSSRQWAKVKNIFQKFPKSKNILGLDKIFTLSFSKVFTATIKLRSYITVSDTLQPRPMASAIGSNDPLPARLRLTGNARLG